MSYSMNSNIEKHSIEKSVESNKMLQSSNHIRLTTTMLLFTTVITLQLAAASMIGGPQEMYLFNNQQQQQQPQFNSMISTMTPLMMGQEWNHHQEPSLSTSKTDELLESSKHTMSDTTTDTSTVANQYLGPFNEFQFDDQNKAGTAESFILNKIDANDLDISSVISKHQTGSVKSRRHANPFNAPVADWWTKLSSPKQHNSGVKSAAESKVEANYKSNNNSNNRPQNGDSTTTSDATKQRRPTEQSNDYGGYGGSRHSMNSMNNGVTKTGFSSSSFNADSTSTAKPTALRTVYKEQPLSQNAILTIKNQLSAIKGKHRLLVTKSMQQLQQLDNKLIESYRLCFKRKMPLYAGMLYRTRDYVVKMAKEVQYERKVLEAMTKQIHTVLHHKMTNHTSVREYNRLVITTTTTESPSLNGMASQYQAGANLQPSQTGAQSVRLTQRVDDGMSQPTNYYSDSYLSTTRDQTTSDAQQQQQQQQQQLQDFNEVSRSPLSSSSIDRREKLSSSLWPAAANGKKPSLAHNKDDNQAAAKSQLSQEVESQRTSTKAKQSKYTVSINEVNLRKELTKIQSLIDRINGSTYEIQSVIDDIIYLFRLNSTDSTQIRRGKPNKLDSRLPFNAESTTGQQAGNLNYGPNSGSDPKQVKKMLKAPIKVFLEKYGKLANLRMNDESSFNGTTNNGSNIDITNMNPPEIKPLFEPSSLVYSELRDPDIGFE